MGESAVKRPILLGPEHDVSGFCSVERQRYALNGVFYRAKTRMVAGTDGHCVIVVPARRTDKNEASTEPDTLIPVGPLKEAIKLAPRREKTEDEKRSHRRSANTKSRERAPVTVQSGEGNELRLTASNTDIERTLRCARIDGRFPPFEEVFPTGKPVAMVAMGARFLSVVAEYAKAHGADASKAINLSFYGPGVCLGFEIPLKTGATARGLIMPIIQD